MPEVTEIEQNALKKLYKSVAYRIVQNEPKSGIITDLMQQGWNQESATELVDNVEDTIEEYLEPPKEWKQKKAKKYIPAMLLGFLSLTSGIVLFIYGLISPEYIYILPIGLLITGLLLFSYGLFGWLRYRK